MEYELMKLGFNINSIGFKYWIKALYLYKLNHWRYGFTIEFIYNEIAQEFQTTRNRVERSMRTASKNARKEIQELYNYKGKVTTKTIFELLTSYKINSISKVQKLESNCTFDDLMQHIPSID